LAISVAPIPSLRSDTMRARSKAAPVNALRFRGLDAGALPITNEAAPSRPMGRRPIAASSACTFRNLCSIL
jgi:hypothetical protein